MYHTRYTSTQEIAKLSKQIYKNYADVDLVPVSWLKLFHNVQPSWPYPTTSSHIHAAERGPLVNKCDSVCILKKICRKLFT